MKDRIKKLKDEAVELSKQECLLQDKKKEICDKIRPLIMFEINKYYEKYLPHLVVEAQSIEIDISIGQEYYKISIWNVPYRGLEGHRGVIMGMNALIRRLTDIDAYISYKEIKTGDSEL